VRRWPLDRRDAVPSDLAELRRFFEAATTAEVDAAGRPGTPR
jgi:hypothetical protein